MASAIQKGNGASVSDMAGAALTTARKRADDVTGSVSSGMKSLAGTIRDHAPAEGALKQVASGAANTLEKTGRYLEKEGLSGMAKDVEHLVRRHPLESLLVCLGVGFLLAHSIRR